MPAALGVRGLVGAFRARDPVEEASPVVATSLVSVAAVTIANGADNISAYTPVFRTQTLADNLVMVGVFAILVGAWCVAGAWLGGHRRVVTLVKRFAIGWCPPCSSRSGRPSWSSPASWAGSCTNGAG